MKEPAARPARRMRPRMKERRSRLSCLRARAPATHPIHFYCKERSARASLETVPEASDRMVLCPEILLEKVDKVRAEDPAERAASAGPVAEEEAAECLAERLVEEE